MQNTIKFCSIADFIFIAEYLAYKDIQLNDTDDIDELYQDISQAFQVFEFSPQFTQHTSYLQAVKDFLNSQGTEQ
jgi:hypothetical protein